MKVPATLSVSTNIRLEPKAQLASVSEAFFIDTKVSNNDGGRAEREGGARNSATVKLMHIEGTVVNLTPDAIVSAFRTDVIPGAQFLQNGILFDNKILRGNIVGRPNLRISSDPNNAASLTSFRLLDSGLLEATNITAINVSPSTDPVQGDADGFTFSRTNLIYNGSPQLTANISLKLPAGLGYFFGETNDSYSGVLESTLEQASVSLDGSLNPTSSINFTPPLPFDKDYYGLVEESKPLGITCSSIIWNRDSGEITPGAGVSGVERMVYLRKDELGALADAAELTLEDRVLRSNELFYQNARPAGLISFSADETNKSARFKGSTIVSTTSFRSHFPYDATITFEADSSFLILDDQPVLGSRLENTTQVTVPYARDCDEVVLLGCGEIGRANHSVNPVNGNTLITSDGGLWASGTPSTSAGARRNREISYLAALPGSENFTHETGDFMTQSRFFMAGHSFDAPTAADLDSGPAILMNSGFNIESTSMHRPGTPDYREGLADYPGMNYRASTESGITSTATLGGNTTIPFPLRDRSKYYIRYSGTSGIHEATPGEFPTPIVISGYPFLIDHFGLSFENSKVRDSTTSGSLTFPEPTDFVFRFDELRFDCLGLPKDTKPSSTIIVPQPASPTLTYWDADIVLKGLDFQTVRDSECNPASARAVVAMRAFASNISSPLHGSLGINPGGDIITPSTRLEPELTPAKGGLIAFALNAVDPDSPEILASGMQIEDDFHVPYQTGRIAGTLGDPNDPGVFSVTFPAVIGRDYKVIVQPVTSTDHKGPLSSSRAIKWSVGNLALPAETPWPARDLSETILARSFDPRIASTFLAGNTPEAAIRIGELDWSENIDPDGLIRTSFNFTRKKGSPEIESTNSFPLNTDYELEIYQNDQSQSIFPFVIYRYQVPNAKFPQVSNQVVQVSPLIDRVRKIEDTASNRVNLYEPFLRLANVPGEPVDSSTGYTKPIGLYARDT